MTDTTTLAPTDAEILDAAEDFRSQYTHGGTTFDEFDEIGFTRAVLAKWGAPAPASQPFAYEFSRSNGDGTHSEHIERGRLQEVAPGRWEHSGLPRGALADKPIKALYTTPQTQPVAVPAGMEPEAAPAQPIMCQPPKSWNKRGQDAYRRGWEDRGNSVTAPADRYLEGCRDGYAQRDAEVMGALA